MYFKLGKFLIDRTKIRQYPVPELAFDNNVNENLSNDLSYFTFKI